MMKLTTYISSVPFLWKGIVLAAASTGLLISLYAHAQTSTIPLCEITRGLGVGTSGEDVRCLQRYLNWAGFAVATSGTGSVGNETQYFGPMTQDAVIRWQNANAVQVLTPLGLSTGTGFWGLVSFGRYVEIVRAALGVH